MPPNRRNAPRLAMVAAVALLAAAGCTASTPPAASGPIVLATLDPALIPSRPPVPSHSPTPRPSARPTPTPRPTTAPPKTAIDKLKIGSPYTLVYNRANPALNATITIQMAGLNLKETINGREIRQRGNLVGFAFVVEIEGYPLTEAALEQVARGSQVTSGGKLSYGTVLGHKVAYIVSSAHSDAMYIAGDHVVLVASKTLPVTKTLLQSVIKANS
jgi:hypothetical protein